jgi:hypothetical protein
MSRKQLDYKTLQRGDVLAKHAPAGGKVGSRGKDYPKVGMSNPAGLLTPVPRGGWRDDSRLAA